MYSFISALVLLSAVMSVTYAQTRAPGVSVGSIVNARFTATENRPRFFLQNLRQQIGSFGGAASAGLQVGNAAVTSGLSMANTVINGALGIKQGVLNLGTNLASQGLGFGTQLAGNLAGIGANFSEAIPVIGGMTGQLGQLGANAVTAVANTVNAAGQTLIATGQALGQSKLDAIKEGVEFGLDAAANGAGALFGIGQTGVDVATNSALQGLITADALLTVGAQTFNDVLNNVNGALATTSQKAGNTATQAQINHRDNLTPGISPLGLRSLTTGEASVSGSGTLSTSG